MPPLSPEAAHRCREALQLEEIVRPGFRHTPAATPRRLVADAELEAVQRLVPFCRCDLCNHVRAALWAEADEANRLELEGLHRSDDCRCGSCRARRSLLVAAAATIDGHQELERAAG